MHTYFSHWYHKTIPCAMSMQPQSVEVLPQSSLCRWWKSYCRMPNHHSLECSRLEEKWKKNIPVHHHWSREVQSLKAMESEVLHWKSKQCLLASQIKVSNLHSPRISEKRWINFSFVFHLLARNGNLTPTETADTWNSQHAIKLIVAYWNTIPTNAKENKKVVIYDNQEVCNVSSVRTGLDQNVVLCIRNTVGAAWAEWYNTHIDVNP